MNRTNNVQLKVANFCLKISIFLCFCNIELKLCKTGDFRGFVSRYGQVFFMISGHFLSTPHLKLLVKRSRQSYTAVFHEEDDTVCASKNKKSRHIAAYTTCRSVLEIFICSGNRAFWRQDRHLPFQRLRSKVLSEYTVRQDGDGWIR